MKLRACAALLVFVASLARGEEPPRPLAHMVYFKLAEDSAAAREKLIAACKEHLSGHEGAISFSVGVLAAEFQRDVNDRDFDVSLHLVFESKAAHDRYQTHPRHLKFVEENRSLWSKVRVFDSYLVAGAGGGDPAGGKRGGERADRLALPDAARRFAGMIRGEVLEKRDDGLVFQVQQVVEEWEHSAAGDAKSLAGKKVLVDAADAEAVRAFLKLVKAGETVSIDVAHKRGEALTLLELTEEQRERVARGK